MAENGPKLSKDWVKIARNDSAKCLGPPYIFVAF